MAEHAKRPLGLYVHWPFCLSKCPYCDFNSHVRARIDADAYAAALVRELHTLAARLDHVRPLTSIFFGGGTPSLMPGECVRAVIDAARQRFGFEPEVTAKIARVKGIRIYEVGISYYGRTYEEGKKIGWRDGFRAIWCILKYNIWDRRHLR